MFLKNILNKWKESLEIFQPKNFKLFLLASLNNFKRSLSTIFSCFFIPIVILFFIFPAISFFIKDVLNNAYSISYFILLIPFLLYFNLYQFLATRASIENKNYSYFFKYTNKIFGIFIILLLLMPIKILLNTNLYVLYSLAVFFFLDSKNSFRSIFSSSLNALTLAIYQLPVFLILTAISMSFESIFLELFNSNINFLHFLSLPLLTILYLLLLSMISIYYTKIKHQEINLFIYN